MVSADDNWVNCSFIHAQLTTVTIRKGEKNCEFASATSEKWFRGATFQKWHYVLLCNTPPKSPCKARFRKKISVFYFIFKNTLSLLQKPKEKGFTAVSKEMKKLDFQRGCGRIVSCLQKIKGIQEHYFYFPRDFIIIIFIL